MIIKDGLDKEGGCHKIPAPQSPPVCFHQLTQRKRYFSGPQAIPYSFPPTWQTTSHLPPPLKSYFSLQFMLLDTSKNLLTLLLERLII